MGQKNSPLLSCLCFISALAMVLLWHNCQKPWSGLSGAVYIDGHGRANMDTMIPASSFGQPLIGANYFLGGISILLLSAGWLMVTTFWNRSDDGDGMAGLITLGTAVLGAIAFFRWWADYEAHSRPVRNSQQNSVVYVAHDAAFHCAGLTIVLALLGLFILVLGRRAGKITANAVGPTATAGQNT